MRPYRFVRYAVPSPDQAAPPYDVLTQAERDALAARHPHSVLLLTLAATPEEGGRTFRRWLDDGTLVRDDEPSAWLLEQEVTLPDGVAAIRRGLVASLLAEPYEHGVVLRHEHTHRAPVEGRLQLLRAADAQVEPLFFVYEGALALDRPARPADLAGAGTSLWRLAGVDVAALFAERQLLIADGHHRYEATLALSRERAAPLRVMALLVASEDPGLSALATHRLYTGRIPELDGESLPDGVDPVAALAAEPAGRAATVLVTAAGARLVRGGAGELDVQLVDRVGRDGISYTASANDALARVRSGEADAALFVRPVSVSDVFERARRDEVLPPKTTFFAPKALSGFLFHPFAP